MPLDAVIVHALASELSEVLEGGRIDRIQQPERDMILLTLRSKGENRKLLIAAGTGNARIHLTKAAFENPKEPPMFCMLLRKHLTGAKILSVEQTGFERILTLELETFDEMGVVTKKRLVSEMTGRGANLILVGEDGRIIDCMRRMSFGGDALRCMQPGMIYVLPPTQNRTPFFRTSSGEIERIIDSADESVPMDRWLLNTFSGLSPLICRELACRCGGEWPYLSAACIALRESVEKNELAPYIVYEDDRPREFSFMPIRQYGAGCADKCFDGFSEMLDEFYTERDRIELRNRRSKELTKTVRTMRDRVQKKIALQCEELKRSEDREAVRIRAELVTANIYRIKKGQRILECENYYEENSPVVRIELDPLKTPQQNSAAMYKQYNKLKGAFAHLSILIGENRKQLDYLNSVLDELERCESERDLADIRSELISAGVLRKNSAKQQKIKPQQPLTFVSDDGFEILVGRSNLQNDELTTKIARRTDVWLHTKNIHGSHVIIRCDGLEVPDKTLTQAASLAAYYSQGREAGKISVDTTMVRNVKKPSGALPGKVIYTDYSTLTAQADEKLAERLRKQ
ncbi:MAG: NFACT RNA binding domain-containing protein [Eubacteriales bacterium]|nr:NFACT RNA binding domain-containing protein [Eubacteriales bacterium]